jgi:hypothetical protein
VITPFHTQENSRLYGFEWRDRKVRQQKEAIAADDDHHHAA